MALHGDPLIHRAHSQDRHVLDEVIRLNAYLPAFLLQCVPAGGLIVDLGAHIGAFTLIASRLLAPSHVVAVEPHPENFSILSLNAARISSPPRVELVAGAAWRNDDMGHLVDLGLETARHHVARDAIGSNGLCDTSSFRFIDIRLTSVDQMLDRLGLSRRTISLIKMDVQGSEVEALAGMTESLRRTSVVVGELHGTVLSEEGLRAMLADFRLCVADDIGGRLTTRMFTAVRRCDLDEHLVPTFRCAVREHHLRTIVATAQARIDELRSGLGVLHGASYDSARSRIGEFEELVVAAHAMRQRTSTVRRRS